MPPIHPDTTQPRDDPSGHATRNANDHNMKSANCNANTACPRLRAATVNIPARPANTQIAASKDSGMTPDATAAPPSRGGADVGRYAKPVTTQIRDVPPSAL